jgi:2-methylisocitrate lyase-like PEP mutase family enzyme
MSSLKASNTVAKAFKALHVSGKPILLANVYDATSARIVGSLPNAKALATASWAVAAANGTADNKLTLATQLKALRPIAEVAHELGKPLSVDIQDGYEDELENAIKQIIELGAVGINLEDTNHYVEGETALLDVDVAAERVRRVLAVAKKEGVDDFVVNARSDAWWYGKPIEETITRGQRYLEAGATTIFVFSPKGYKAEEITALVKGFDGKLNVGGQVAPPGQEVKGLGVAKLAELGVARLSLGPQLYLIAEQAIKDAAMPYLG